MALYEAANVITDPDQLSATIKLNPSQTIDTIAVTSNVVTVVTDTAHFLSDGDYVTLDSTQNTGQFDGTFGPITVAKTAVTGDITSDGTNITFNITSNPFVDGDYIIVTGTTNYNGRFGPVINSGASSFQIASTLNEATENAVGDVQDQNETDFTYSDTQGDQAATTDPGTVEEAIKPDSEVLIDLSTAGDDANPFLVGVAINTSGVVTKDGVTLKALYSFLKDQWSADADLIKFDFPLIPITDEQFEFTAKWNFDTTAGGLGDANTESQLTNALIRTGGWAVKKSNGNFSEKWVSVITLGALDINDQVYYQYDDLVTADNTVNFLLTGPVNQAVQFYSDTNFDNTPDFERTSNLTTYVRTWEKTYAQTNLADIGVTTVQSQAYRFPLTNAADVKITGLSISEAAASGVDINIDTITGDGATATVTTNADHNLVTGDVVDISGATTGTGFNSTANTITVTGAQTFTYANTETTGEPTDSPAVASGTYYNNMSMTWFSPSVERPLSGVYNASGSAGGSAYHTVIIDADAGSLFTGVEPSIEQVYAWTQAQLRRQADIDDDGVNVKIGTVVPLKLQFIGDAIFAIGYTDAYSSEVNDFEGLAIDNFNNGDINNLHFWGYGSATTTTSTITSINGNGTTISVTTGANHNLAVGDYITISGTTNYNGTFIVATQDGTTGFTITDPLNPGAESAGTVVPAEYNDLTFPFSANLIINFGGNLVDDTDAIYKVFFTNDDAGSNLGRDFGTVEALVVNDGNGDPMSGSATTSSVTLTYAYDTNTQRGNGTPQPAPITAVAIGLQTAQYVSATATINRVETTTVSLIAPLERNYDPGSV